MSSESSTSAATGPRVHRAVHAVGPEDTAVAVGSGTVEVLGTPRLVAWCEGATVALADLDGLAPGRTTVGTRIEIDHLRPSPVGEDVAVTATLREHEGRRWTFDVTAEHDDGTLVARGVVHRTEVEAEGFGQPR